MRRKILVLGSAFLFALSGPLFAAGPGSGTSGSGNTSSNSGTNTATPRAIGQPNQSCQAEPETPGNSMFAPGSAFNPFGIAGMNYAGQQPQNSNNPAAVSQYDVACANQP